MASDPKSPIRPTNDEARALAQSLLDSARFGALGVIDPDSGAPMVSRIAVGRAPDGTPLTLISDLSHHTKALRVNPDMSLLIGEPEQRGDPLTHPRMTLMGGRHIIPHADPAYGDLAQHYLKTHSKSKLYIGFTDFSFALFKVKAAHLNGGFGKAFTLTPQDLGL